MMIGNNIIKESKQAKNGDFLKRISTVVSLLCFTFLTGGVLVSSAVRGATTNVEASVSVTAIACTFTGSGMDSHSAVLSNGLLSENIGTTTFSATCNDPGGFAIYAVGNSGATEGTTSLVSSAGSSYNIATGTATSGETSNWAMKVTPTNGLATVDNFSSYHAVPSSYTRVAVKTSGELSGTVAVASSTYRVWTAPGQMTGNYTGQVKYTLVHPSTEECPEGYSLEGGICEKSQLIMQDVDTWGSTLTINEAVQAVDSRDNKTYWVTKLADGNIWMTQNLDLDLNASTLPLTSATSDVSADWNPGSTYYTKTATSSSSTNTDMYSWNLGDYVYDGTTDSDCGTSATSYADCTDYGFSLATSLAADSTQRHYHVGNLYQWNAATAGTGGTITSGEATDSICPKGWRLPTSGSSGEFKGLVDAYSVGSTVTLINSPLYFVRGGGVDSGTLRSAGDFSFYRSSTPYVDSSHAYSLGFGGTSYVRPSYDYYRYLGMGVRCIADAK